MKIGIDFDGTCVTSEFPNIGKDIGAIPILKQLVENGQKLILYTMRSNIENPQSNSNDIINKGGNYLDDAVDWFKRNNIILYGIQKDPKQYLWTNSPKASCDLYIDDSALGCPLMFNKNKSKKPFVNWKKVEKYLKEVYNLL